MAKNIDFDDSNLQRLFAELDVKQRTKALKGAFRKEANNVKKVAINNLRSCIRSSKDMESGVRALVFKQKAGFRVTVGTKKSGTKEYGFHMNQQGLKKPILIWAEDGTQSRKTKSHGSFFGKSRKGRNTGRMRRYGFMQRTLSETRDSVTGRLREEIILSVEKVAKKYGCK